MLKCYVPQLLSDRVDLMNWTDINNTVPTNKQLLDSPATLPLSHTPRYGRTAWLTLICIPRHNPCSPRLSCYCLLFLTYSFLPPLLFGEGYPAIAQRPEGTVPLSHVTQHQVQVSVVQHTHALTHTPHTCTVTYRHSNRSASSQAGLQQRERSCIAPYREY